MTAHTFLPFPLALVTPWNGSDAWTIAYLACGIDYIANEMTFLREDGFGHDEKFSSQGSRRIPLSKMEHLLYGLCLAIAQPT